VTALKRQSSEKATYILNSHVWDPVENPCNTYTFICVNATTQLME
jgi:hypothetical protein